MSSIPWSPSASSVSSPSPPATCSACSTNASHASCCRRVNRYAGLFHVCSFCVRAKNIIICCHGRTCLTMASLSMYGCNGWNRVWCFSVRIASNRTNTPIRSMTDAWLNRANPSMAAQIAASTGSASSSFLGSGSVMGSSTHANKSGLSMPTKYGNHCVRSNHGFTSSLSPSWMVFCARFSMLSHVLAICSPTWAHAASPSTGTTLGLSSPGSWTWKYCDPWPCTNSRWQWTVLQPLPTRLCIFFCSTRLGRPSLTAGDQLWAFCQCFLIASALRNI